MNDDRPSRPWRTSWAMLPWLLMTACGDKAPVPLDEPRTAPAAAAQASAARPSEAASPPLSSEARALAEDAARERELAARRNDPAEIKQRECTLQKVTLGGLRYKLHPPPGEAVPPDEAAALPAEIAKIERFLAQECRGG